MREKRMLLRFLFVLLPIFWLTLSSLHNETLYGADLSEVNLHIEGMT